MMSAAVVAFGIASIFVAAFASHMMARRRRAAEAIHQPAIPEFKPEAKTARRIHANAIRWEI